MKVKFLKKHRAGIKIFMKDEVAVVHWTLGQELVKKKIAEETDVTTIEDKVLKQLRDGNDGED